MKHQNLAALSLVLFAAGCGAAPDGNEEFVETSSAEIIYDDGNLPDPGDEPLPPPPPPPAPAPGIAFQISPCLPSAEALTVRESLRSAMASALVSVDLKNNGNGSGISAWADAACVNGSHRFGVWMKSVGGYGAGDTTDSRRDRLEGMNMLQGTENLAARFSASTIRTLLGYAWADLDKSFNSNGQATNGGPIYLQSMNTAFYDAVVGMPGKKRVTTTIHGYYDGPFSNTGFDLGIHDTLGIDGSGFLTCNTSTSLSMETTVDSLLNDIFNVSHVSGDDFADLVGQGPSCYAVKALPKQWLLPGKFGANLGFKEVFRWGRLTVDANGISMGGNHTTEARTPAVSISGPDPLKVEFGDPVSGVYKAGIQDLRPPVTYQWSSSNATASGSAATTTLTWNIVLNSGQYVSKVIHVTATDADGITASASRTVVLKRVMYADLPEFCDSKPWSPECNPE